MGRCLRLELLVHKRDNARRHGAYAVPTLTQIRDKWGLVYQVLGLDAPLAVQSGSAVAPGTALGTAPAHALREPTMEPPSWLVHEGGEMFPFRYRAVEVRVALPSARWAASAATWPGPDADGWTYFHPLLAFAPSTATPLPPLFDPPRIFLAQPRKDVRKSPVAIPPYRYSRNIPLPPLVELIASFQVFEPTPGDPGDAYDPVSLYALDWAAMPAHAFNTSLCTAPGVYWRRAFEHSKVRSSRHPH